MAQKITHKLGLVFRNFDLVFFASSFCLQFLVLFSDLPRGYESGKILGFNLILIVGVIFVSARLLHTPNFLFKNLTKKNLGIIILALAVSLSLGAISTFLSEYQQIAVFGNFFRGTGFLFFTQLHLFLLLTLFIAKRENLFKYLQIYLTICFLQLPFIIANLLSLQTFEQFLTGYYVGGSFGQSNFLAGQMLSGFLVSGSIYLFIKKQKLYLLLSAGFALMLLPTLSYGGMILLILLPSLVLLINYCREKIKFSLLVVFLFILLSMVSFSLATWHIDEARGLYAIGAVELISDRPIVGHGLDTFREGSAKVGLGDRNVDRVHHMFLDIAYSLGLPLAVIAFLFLILIISVKQKRSVFLFSIPVLVFLITTNIHTRSAYHYIELSVFVGLWLIAYLDKSSWRYK